LVHPEKQLGLSRPRRIDHKGEFVGWEVDGDICENGDGGLGRVGEGDGREGEFAYAILLGNDFADVDGTRGEGQLFREDRM
jgi:hypothetical protein